ncbi:MAG: divergent PAP2 family protein [Anaerolineaceae bacterium]|nr:divergent PAP2 family protein [Anaerolineaceae bacterium]MDD4043113.1 divergent PAP2 family protein [Anaerolineaceae bacterium]MDD4576989.1 divergent PAP2 family protein [Anaerolineaceae bacterium]
MSNPLDFFKSPIAISAMLGWILAQLIKLPVGFLRTKKWDWALLINAGGMPSSHSALMSAVSTAIGLQLGWNSPIFILALSMTGIVIYDATGVRRQAGFHAERINQIIRNIVQEHKIDEPQRVELLEIIGHSPAEAAVGALLGIVIAIAVWLAMV